VLLRRAHLHGWWEAIVPHHVQSSSVLLECPYNMAADPEENRKEAVMSIIT